MDPEINDGSISSIIKELGELEDVYAQCLMDNVEPKTLNQLWNRIKALRKLLEDKQKSN